MKYIEFIISIYYYNALMLDEWKIHLYAVIAYLLP